MVQQQDETKKNIGTFLFQLNLPADVFSTGAVIDLHATDPEADGSQGCAVGFGDLSLLLGSTGVIRVLASTDLNRRRKKEKRSNSTNLTQKGHNFESESNPLF